MDDYIRREFLHNFINLGRIGKVKPDLPPIARPGSGAKQRTEYLIAVRRELLRQP